MQKKKKLFFFFFFSSSLYFSCSDELRPVAETLDTHAVRSHGCLAARTESNSSHSRGKARLKHQRKQSGRVDLRDSEKRPSGCFQTKSVQMVRHHIVASLCETVLSSAQ